MKEEKKKKKSKKQYDDSDDDSEGLSRYSRRKTLEVEEDSDADNIPRQPPMKSSLTSRALPPIERSPRLSHKSYSNTNNDNGDSDNELGNLNLSRPSWNIKSTTPRPDSGTASLDLAAPRFGSSWSYDDTMMDRGGLGRRGLAPLAPLAPLEPLDGGMGRKWNMRDVAVEMLRHLITLNPVCA